MVNVLQFELHKGTERREKRLADTSVIQNMHLHKQEKVLSAVFVDFSVCDSKEGSKRKLFA